MKPIKKFSFLVLLAFVFSFTNAQQFVQDEANLFSEEEKKSLQETLETIEKDYTIELVVMTVKSLNGQDIIDFAIEKTNQMGIGKKHVNNGALVLIAEKDRKVRIEIGYGLEWQIRDNDAQSFVNQMIPFLKEKKYFDASNLAVEKIKKYGSKVQWTIFKTSFEEYAKKPYQSKGKIIQFHGTIIGQEEDFLIVKSDTKDKVNLYLTENMGSLAKKLKTEGEKAIITARVKDHKENTFLLLGVN